MGPRLCSRGDRRYRGDRHVRLGQASMGPRLCSRGDAQDLGVSIEETRASMGPRLCSRGDKWPGTNTCRDHIRFNGAAAL